MYKNYKWINRSLFIVMTANIEKLLLFMLFDTDLFYFNTDFCVSWDGKKGVARRNAKDKPQNAEMFVRVESGE